MPRHERRQHFRMEDDVYFNYRIVDPDDIYSDRVFIDKPDGKNGQKYLEVSRYFQDIDCKIDFLSLQMLITGAVQMHKVSISLGGMSFKTQEFIKEKTNLKIVLYTKPKMIPIILDATSVYSEYQNEYEYRTAVEFTGLTAEQKQLLSQHLLSQQRKYPSDTGITQELNDIKRLLANNHLKGKKLLDEANSIFIALTNRPHQQTRLNWLASELANKCYQKYSKKYFAHCSKAIEKQLLYSDWRHASWYRKTLQTLSCGYLRVPQHTDINQIKINIDFNSDEFQSHVIQLNFLPPSIFDNLGEPQSSRLKEFLFANLGLEPQNAVVSVKKIIDDKIMTVA